MLIERKWLWNNGNLITCGLADLKNGTYWKVTNKQPDLMLTGEPTSAGNGNITAEYFAASAESSEQVRVTVYYRVGTLDVKKILKLFPNCPAIACELYLKGKASHKWLKTFDNPADMQNVERLLDFAQMDNVPVIEQLSLDGRHWKLKAVEFSDITDRFNSLVHPVEALSYKNCSYRGNLLFAENTERKAGLFFLKEAPTSNIQLKYPGGDFLTNAGRLRIIGLGIDSADLNTDKWTRAYGYVTGVYRPEKIERLNAVREYMKTIRPLFKERDEMVMLNTWGDRGQDTRINESFCLNELELAAKLGITHFELDDGWQTGRSANSAYGGTFTDMWKNDNYWKPDPKRFPNGLEPIVKRGKELGIEICLWFNPSSQNDYADWEKDANALISIYKTFGIRTFKIDGTTIPNKLSEIRLRNFYESIMKATDWKAVLNLDVTAGRRGGYFFFKEYGNQFLENRYTDWNNYYPYWTLRNLWMLSEYVPAQTLQIEFLNKWRNTDKYKGDKFAPANYSFDYLFATTMAAQPLAWFEAANLPTDAFTTGALIKKYKSVQHDFHTGYIFPIGEEPSGESWTGFQSLKDKRGYFILYREDNERSSCSLSTFLKEGSEVEFTPVLGSGKAFRTKAGKDGAITFYLEKPKSFVMYSYKIK